MSVRLVAAARPLTETENNSRSLGVQKSTKCNWIRSNFVSKSSVQCKDVCNVDNEERTGHLDWRVLHVEMVFSLSPTKT